jgi:hypothetical protein
VPDLKEGAGAGYDEVRRRLVERGYLQGRIERFVLRDIAGPGSKGTRLLVAGLKAAALGAPIVGAFLTGAVVAANRPLPTAADVPLLWLYLSVAAGAALFVLDVSVAVALAWLARRRGAREGDALRASLLVGLPTLAYLVMLVWKSDAPSGPAEDLLFLAGALVAALLVSRLAGLVSLAGIVGQTGDVPDRRKRAALLLVLALLPPVALYLLARVATGDPAAARPATEFVPASGVGRIFLAGVDGLDGALVEALEPRGAVPNLLAGMARGAVFPKRRAAGPEPPEVWTTIMTGATAAEHGVRSVGAARLPGVATPLRTGPGVAPLAAALRFLLPVRTVPTSGAARRVRTLWEIVDLKAPAAAVGWWTSWPAGEGDTSGGRGYVVSDRVLAKLLSGGREDRDTSPASLFARLRNDFETDRRAIREEFDSIFLSTGRGDLRDVAWESFLIDAYAFRIADRLGRDPALRAVFVYLPGLDILRRRIEGSGAAETGAVALLTRQAALEAYVRWLDGRLGPVLAPASGARAIVVADPGRTATQETEGFVIVAGGSGRAGCVGPVLSDLDVAPLSLAVAGYPRSLEMPGRLPGACLERLRDLPPPVATFGRRAFPTRSAASDYDPEMVERLRSLGYLR